MPVIAGVDEVGYGPWLGPLVVCSTAFRAAQPELELWEALRSAVAREPDGERLAVNDSKELYSPARGIGGLEPTVLSFLAMLPELPGTSFRALACRLSLERSLALCAPWYEGADFAIPQLEGDLGGRAVALWDALRRANAVALSCRAAWVEPEEFNRVVQSRKNKSDLLFERACALVKSILEAAPREDVSIALGKQGGRRMY
ncbi:MAG: hypothetical protein HYY16_19180, partial [Planctomycetes bacterium]|nr:hypothetical protein [Planctomycetota bacterium]